MIILVELRNILTAIRQRKILPSAPQLQPDLGWKTLSNFGRDLAIGHLIRGFNRKDMTFESFVLKTFF